MNTLLLILCLQSETINLVVTNSTTINIIVLTPSNLVGQATSAGEFVKGNDGNWYEKTTITERFSNYDGTETTITRAAFKKVDASTIPMRKANGALQQPIPPPMPISTNKAWRVIQLANPPPPIPTDSRDKMRKFFKEGGQKGRQ